MVKNLVEKLATRGDEVISQFAGELVLTNAFSTALEQVLRTKGFIERQVQTALKTMNLASRDELDEAGDRIRRIQRDLRRLETRIEHLERAAAAAPPPVNAPGTDARPRPRPRRRPASS